MLCLLVKKKMYKLVYKTTLVNLNSNKNSIDFFFFKKKKKKW